LQLTHHHTTHKNQAQQYNRHFRTLIADAYPLYSAKSSKLEKREMGIHIYLKVVKGGGRFLDAEGIPMNRNKAILKVMKALKDAKLWAGGGGMAAAKRREEARIGEKTKGLEGQESVEQETDEAATVVAVAEAKKQVEADVSDEESVEESVEETDESSCRHPHYRR
jgi:hypothetical protein